MPAILEQPKSAATAFLPSLGENDESREISAVAVITLVLWTGCLIVGFVGFVLPYARPVPPKKLEPPIQAKILQVELTNDPLPPITQQPETSVAPPPDLMQPPAAIPEVPPMTAVAEPSTVAFALPVEGPVVLVEPAKASFTAAPVEQPKPVQAPLVRTLTYGQGEGRQPAPEYPLRARQEGQEGVVAIRFSVGDDGRVLAAEAVGPSPWKLLNDSALRVIRERWKFSSGSIRLYEVSIRFQLKK